MPPKPIAEQLARKKAEKDKGGWGWAGNLVGDLIDMAKNPVDTAKTLGSMAKDTFIDPVLDLPEAFRPGSGLSPAERVATGIGGGLAIADAVTPLVPEGAFANSAQRALAKRMADASNSGRKYRGALGVHGSPITGLDEIRPFSGSLAMPDDEVAFTFNFDAVAPNKNISSATGRPTLNMAEQYAMRNLRSSSQQPEIYFARFPRQSGMAVDDAVTVYRQPGRVVGSVPASSPSAAYKRAIEEVMTPSERRRFLDMRLNEQLGRSKYKRKIVDMQRQSRMEEPIS